MSSISSVSSGANAWSTMSASRASRQQEMFKKVDTDGNGSVSETELKSMFSDMAAKTGKSVSGSENAFAKMDANGDGSLDASELKDGMKSLMPPPSTVSFAKRHGDGDGDGDDRAQSMGPPPGPPPQESSSTSASSSSSSKSDFDPLDTNKDGVVSEQEKAAGEMKNAILSMLQSADTDGDKKISKSELSAFKDVLSTISNNLSSSDSSSASSTSASTKPFSISTLADMVSKEYAKLTSANTQSNLGTTLSLAA